MHAWAALKPAEIVQAAQTLRDLFKSEKLGDDAQDVRSADAPAADDARAGGSAAAE